MALPHTVVVGAGIAGASVAFGLARRGAPVTVVDDARDGRATAAGAGIVQPWSSAATGTYYDLYARGAAHYETFVDQLAEHGSGDLGYRRSGSLVVSADPREIDVVAARLRTRRATAPEMGAVERVDGPGCRPGSRPCATGCTGSGCPAGRAVDGRLLVAGVLAAVERLGGSVSFGDGGVAPDCGRGHRRRRR